MDVVQEYSWQLGTLAACGALAISGLYSFRKWVGGGVCRSQAKLDGKTVIITGANTGIGLESAVDLAKRNARVILACRSVERGETAAVEVRKRSGNDNVVFVQLDLASLDSVRKFAAKILEEEPRIDILINNAGMHSPHVTRTEDNFERHMGVNYLAPFLLTNLLLDRLKEAPSARIVNVSSLLYKRCETFEFDKMNSDDPTRVGTKKNIAYNQSKLANILFTRALAKRLVNTNVTVNALHPGIIKTDLARDTTSTYSWLGRCLINLLLMIILKTPQQGAQTTIHCAVAEELEGVSGRYFGDCREEQLKTAISMNDRVAERLWKISSEMVNLKQDS